jgi:hypothetical protein
MSCQRIFVKFSKFVLLGCFTKEVLGQRCESWVPPASSAEAERQKSLDSRFVAGRGGGGMPGLKSQTRSTSLRAGSSPHGRRPVRGNPAWGTNLQ